MIKLVTVNDCKLLNIFNTFLTLTRQFGILFPPCVFLQFVLFIIWFSTNDESKITLIILILIKIYENTDSLKLDTFSCLKHFFFNFSGETENRKFVNIILYVETSIIIEKCILKRV